VATEDLDDIGEELVLGGWILAGAVVAEALEGSH
jgi:hypothetical protein